MRTLALIALLLGLIPILAADTPSRPRHFRLAQPEAGSPEDLLGWITNRAVIRTARGASASEYKSPKGDWTPTKVGVTVTEGQSIRTGTDCSLDLFLGENGPVIRITENSAITLLRLRLRKKGVETRIETVIRLTQGRILGNVKKMHKTSLYKIITPCGASRVYGTEYSATADCQFNVVSGEVTVWDRASGQITKLNMGEASSAPLLPKSERPGVKRPLFAPE